MRYSAFYTIKKGSMAFPTYPGGRLQQDMQPRSAGFRAKIKSVK